MAKKKESPFTIIPVDPSVFEEDEQQPGIPMYQKAPSDLVIPNEFKIGNQVLNKATLIAQRDKDVLHTITGIDDTAGYKKAIELRAVYRTTRTTLEKVRKEMSAPHQKFVTELKKATDDLGKEAFIGEDYFDSLITAYDNEKERIRQEKEAEKQRVIQTRINDLIKLGFTFDGTTYNCPYEENLCISSVDVAIYSSQEFGWFLIEVETAHNKEQKRIDAERQQAEQEALVAQQQKEEAEALIQQQAEANETERNALREKRTAMRLKELIKIHGFVYDNELQVCQHPTIPNTLTLNEIEVIQDTDWDIIISDIENYSTPEPIEEVVPDVLGMATDLNEATTFDAVDEIKTVERFLKFDSINTHFDIKVGPKRTIRLFFEEFKRYALAGCEIDKEGNYQGLHWAIIKT